MTALAPFDRTAARNAAHRLTHRYVFVCGLHRSGTTLITRCLAAHEDISAFRNTGVIEDEGQFLQTVFPLERFFGGVGRFGFDPRAHMTEESALNTPEAAVRLRREWHPHWDLGRPILIEKTPSNLLRMRLLRALFPDSVFLIVTRHPVAASLATMKWTEGNLFSLMAHWVQCYRLARADAAHLDRTAWISYEAFVRDPGAALQRLTNLLDVPARNLSAPEIRDENQKYFATWRSRYYADPDRTIAQKPPERPRTLVTRVRDRIARDRAERALPLHKKAGNLRHTYDALDAVAAFESAVQEFGYSLADLTHRPDW